jgi:hypothetical protein
MHLYYVRYNMRDIPTDVAECDIEVPLLARREVVALQLRLLLYVVYIYKYAYMQHIYAM